MADYSGYTRTNYFKVTNEDALFKLIDECGSKDPRGIEIWTFQDEDGSKLYAFASESDLLGLPIVNDDNNRSEEDDCVHELDFDYDDFIRELQKLLPDGEAVLITNIGKEKLCYLHGDMHVVTNKQTVRKSLHSIGIETARTLLDNAKWDTKNEY